MYDVSATHIFNLNFHIIFQYNKIIQQNIFSSNQNFSLHHTAENLGSHQVLNKHCYFRATYDTSISELPSLDTADLACDSCKQKDITEKATVYCRQCSRRFCAKHQEVCFLSNCLYS